MVPCLVGHGTGFGSRALHQEGPRTPLTFPVPPWETFSPSASSAPMPPNTSRCEEQALSFSAATPQEWCCPGTQTSPRETRGEALCRVMDSHCWGEVKHHLGVTPPAIRLWQPPEVPSSPAF